MNKNLSDGQKKCALCHMTKPLSHFISITKKRDGKAYYGTVCCACLGIDSSKFHLHLLQKQLKKLVAQQKFTKQHHLFSKSKHAAKDHKDHSDDDEGGSGGKQYQKNKSVETLAHEIQRSLEQVALEQENQKNQKQKKVFDKYQKDLIKQAKAAADKADEDKILLNQEQTDEQKENHQADSESDKHKKQSAQEKQRKLARQTKEAKEAKSAKEVNKQQQSKQSTQHNKSSSATNKTAGIGFGVSSKAGQSTNINSHQNHNLQEKTAQQQHQHEAKALQKLAAMLFNKQQHAPNSNAPAKAETGNRVGISLGESLAEILMHQLSGHDQLNSQAAQRNSQSAEANERVSQELAKAQQATQARWGK